MGLVSPDWAMGWLGEQDLLRFTCAKLYRVCSCCDVLETIFFVLLVTLAVAFDFLPKSFGRWWGPTNVTLSFYECRLSGRDTQRWGGGHLNPTCRNQICLNFCTQIFSKEWITVLTPLSPPPNRISFHNRNLESQFLGKNSCIFCLILSEEAVH